MDRRDLPRNLPPAWEKAFGAAKKPRKGKYNASRVELPDGRRFDSKAEARYALQLDADIKAGWILGYLCQVPIRLAPPKDGKPAVRYVCDFMKVIPSEEDPGACKLSWVDVKGIETAMFKTKKRLVEHQYPWIEIQIVSSKWVARNCPELPAGAKVL